MASRIEFYAPFQYHGSKATIAPRVWERLGNPTYYVEPFAGSLGMLLARPHFDSRHHETIGDADSMIAHFWRALRNDPERVASYTVGPLTSVDFQCRHEWLRQQRTLVTQKTESDPNWYDSKIAGWWAWGQNLTVSGAWCGRDRIITTTLSWSQMNNRLRRLSEAELATLFTALAARLTNVGMVQGDWSKTLDLGLRRARNMSVGILMDPPYSLRTGRHRNLYAVDDYECADNVAEWCRAFGERANYRIALCGQKGEHHLPGWRCFAWKNRGGGNRHDLERIWFSPNCMDWKG
jgi:DNA adenine methylase